MKQDEQTIVEHLTEFRRRFLSVFVCFFLVFVVGLFGAPALYGFLTSSLSQKLVVLGPDDILWIYVRLASLVAIVFSLPMAAYQLWAYVQPALSVVSARTILAYIVAIFSCCLAGLAFGFFLVTPALLEVLMSLGKDLFETQLTAQNYLNFVFHTTVPLAILFEFPVIVAFLTSLSILSPAFLVQYRRYAYFLLLCLAVMLTPADFLSDIAMFIPFMLIYEMGIVTSLWITYRKEKKEKKDGIIT